MAKKPKTRALRADDLDRVGGTLVQAADELASIDMIIGASYGGDLPPLPTRSHEDYE